MKKQEPKKINSENGFWTRITNNLKAWFANFEFTLWNKTYIYIMADTIEELQQNSGKNYQKAIKKLKKQIRKKMECRGCKEHFDCLLKKRGLL